MSIYYKYKYLEVPEAEDLVHPYKSAGDHVLTQSTSVPWPDLRQALGSRQVNGRGPYRDHDP